MGTCCLAQGAQPSAWLWLRSSGLRWEGGSRGKGCMYSNGWFTVWYIDNVVEKRTQHCKAIISQLKYVFFSFSLCIFNALLGKDIHSFYQKQEKKKAWSEDKLALVTIDGGLCRGEWLQDVNQERAYSWCHHTDLLHRPSPSVALSIFKLPLMGKECLERWTRTGITGWKQNKAKHTGPIILCPCINHLGPI